MATPTKHISELSPATVLDNADEFVIVDKSDVSTAASGTTKRLTVATLLADPLFKAALPASLTPTQIVNDAAAIVALNTRYVSSDSAHFTVMPKASTAAGGSIYGKTLGSGVLAPWELVYDDTESYMFHMVGGPNAGGNGAYIGMGVMYGATGLVVRNYGDAGPEVPGGTGRATLGINFQNLATVTNINSFGMIGMQYSTAAPLMYLQAMAAGGATLLKLTSNSVVMNAGTKLQEWGGGFGYVQADNGVLHWQKNIETVAVAAGDNPVIQVRDEVAAPGNTRVYLRSKYAAAGLNIWRWAGTAALGYAWQISAEDVSLKFKAPQAAAGEGSETLNTMIWMATSNRMAFFGAAPTVRPTGVAVTAAGVHAALVSLGLITA